MRQYQVEESAVIPAPADVVYGIIADYHEKHPSILPSRYFTDLAVTQGGYGAGTEIRVEMNVFGAKALYNLAVSEPEPGRVLLEEDIVAGTRTTFTVDPLADGAASQVTIRTTARLSPGVRGLVEQMVNPLITRRIYREELAQLATVAGAT